MTYPFYRSNVSNSAAEHLEEKIIATNCINQAYKNFHKALEIYNLYTKYINNCKLKHKEYNKGLYVYTKQQLDNIEYMRIQKGWLL